MSEAGDRPDPDALLRRVTAQSERTKRAKLKIFFGFAPGVGKTYRMLQVARDLEAQGIDVVVGLVETHKRPETAALLAGREVLPRRQVPYRGRTLEEFDLERALARKPRLILVDELAHTNAEGSRHTKRWQDVLDLLDAGIDVFTTVNVQHIESLNDVVAQITHVQVRETVPDTVMERADEVELVDISPEQLLIRLKEGKVYLPEQAARATNHFFQRGNLLALRELALRQTAEHVESDVQEYREEHGVSATWATTERVLVSVGPAPASARLVRAARRMAAGLRASWVAVYVEATKRRPLNDKARARLEANLRLAESLGATVVRLSGVDVAEPLLAYARKHNVTRMIIGKPTHNRLWDRLKGSLLDDVVRGSGEIDVHVISGDTSGGPSSGPEPEHSVLTPRSTRAYLTATALIAGTTLLGLFVRSLLPIPDLEMLYLVAVMVAAHFFGRGPSILAAALSVAAYDFFFVPPYLTFAVRDTQHFLTFGMMFLVGIILSAMTSRLRRQEQDALAREQRSSALYALSGALGAKLDPRDAADVIALHASDGLDSTCCVLAPDQEGSLRLIGAAPKDVALEPTELGVAKWVFEHGRLAGLGTDTLPGSRVVCAQLRVGTVPLGVVALAPRSGKGLTADQRSFFEAFCRQAAYAFERARLSSQAHTSAVRAKTEELRSSLLSAVSHDLRTPLAAITGAATSMRDDHSLPDATRAELLESICDEAERLERLVVNLLDMTRVESGGIAPKREWIPSEEVIGAALTRLDSKLRGRKVTTHLDDGLPLLSVDPVLMQQLFVNLIENALKYTPEGSPLEIAASAEGQGVEIRFRDHGPGLSAGEESRVFEKFYRGAQAGTSGVGLGLSICKGIVEAHGGSIHASNHPEGGAQFLIRLPVPAGAPSMPVSEPGA